MTIDIPEGYESLGLALGEAAAQASRGKGAERHAESGEKFSDQLIMSIPKRLGPGGECFCLGQALKKTCESRRLPPDRARAEILGAINYLAAAWSLLGGAESVFVSAPEDREMPLFAEGTSVEFLPGECGVWEPAMYRGVDSDGGHLVAARGGVLACVPADRIRKPEEAAAPRFAKGELVEYESPDGTWKPARFVCADGGYSVLETGEGRCRVLSFSVRPAEKA